VVGVDDLLQVWLVGGARFDDILPGLSPAATAGPVQSEAAATPTVQWEASVAAAAASPKPHSSKKVHRPLNPAKLKP